MSHWKTGICWNLREKQDLKVKPIPDSVKKHSIRDGGGIFAD
jgi:hypothetical protein